MASTARCKSCNRFLKQNSHGTLCLTCVERYGVQKNYIRVPLGVGAVGDPGEGPSGQNSAGGKNMDPQLISLLKELVERVEGGQGKRKLPQPPAPPAKRVAYGSDPSDMKASYERERERERDRERERERERWSNHATVPRPDEWDMRSPSGRPAGPRPDEWDLRSPSGRPAVPRPDEWDIRPPPSRTSGPRPEEWDIRPPRLDEWDLRPPPVRASVPRPDEWDIRPPRPDEWDIRPPPPPPSRAPVPRPDEWDIRLPRPDEWDMRPPTSRASGPRVDEWSMRPRRTDNWEMRRQSGRATAARGKTVNRRVNGKTPTNVPKKRNNQPSPAAKKAEKSPANKAAVNIPKKKEKAPVSTPKKEEKAPAAKVAKSPASKDASEVPKKEVQPKADVAMETSPEETEVKREREVFQFSPSETPDFIKNVCSVLNLEPVDDPSQMALNPAASGTTSDSTCFPPNKFLEALVQKEWKQLDKRHVKTSYCKKLYSFPKDWSKIWENAPPVDSSVASVALQSKEPVKPSVLPKGVVERRVDIASRRAFMASGEVISTAVASSLVNQALIAWLDQISPDIPEDSEAHKYLSLIQLCTKYLADATRDIVKGGARASVAQVTARRAVWLRNWNPKELLQSQLLKLPFQGELLFGKDADNLVEQFKESEKKKNRELKLRQQMTPQRSLRGQRGRGARFTGSERIHYGEPDFPEDMEPERYFRPERRPERRLPSYSEYLNFIENELRSYPGDLYPEDLSPPRFFRGQRGSYRGSPVFTGRERIPRFSPYPEEDEERQFFRGRQRSRGSRGSRGRGQDQQGKKGRRNFKGGPGFQQLMESFSKSSDF